MLISIVAMVSQNAASVSESKGSHSFLRVESPPNKDAKLKWKKVPLNNVVKELFLPYGNILKPYHKFYWSCIKIREYYTNFRTMSNITLIF